MPYVNKMAEVVCDRLICVNLCSMCYCFLHGQQTIYYAFLRSQLFGVLCRIGVYESKRKEQMNLSGQNLALQPHPTALPWLCVRHGNQTLLPSVPLL